MFEAHPNSFVIISKDVVQVQLAIRGDYILDKSSIVNTFLYFKLKMG